ncbi:AtzH-like domain-containing protein [Nocardioides zeae]|uniref:Ketosteroid isomerase-like protein n=1 Tax=Nocardioides zeae TaxID=1457234 RepID=A0AAJ1U1W8_9ACTN|nr:AtzH-like domain-containing protein [Nocardioides zeae]MDQ1106055.1 ketosteroid isomerase-like protein [Nocardioides zeae]
MIPIDDPDVLAEVEAASARYESALATGDVDALVDAFWVDRAAVRIGDDEELFGHAAITAWRRATAAGPVRRTVRERAATAFGHDLATVHLVTDYPDEGRTGRQTQLWLRTDAGWRVAQAHVSRPASPRRPEERP